MIARRVAKSIGLVAIFPLLVCFTANAAGNRSLKIYFIDVEGGQSTLIVTPSRESFLVDTGFAADGGWKSPAGDAHLARDANRILRAAQDAGVDHIDHLLITHFHQDHDGGVPELARLMPIREFIDHGTPSDQVETTVPGASAAYAAYETVLIDKNHVVAHPGDHLTIPGVDVTVLASANSVLSASIQAAEASSNTACTNQIVQAAEPHENPRSTAVLVQFGHFRFLDVGDLSGSPLHGLVCPRDKVGPVDVYLVAHHGGADSADPATFATFRPRVAVMNNGKTKGGARNTYELLHHVAGLEDVWQIHASDAAAEMNFAPDRIANLDETTAFWIELEAKKDGSFRICNQRVRECKDYSALTR